MFKIKDLSGVPKVYPLANDSFRLLPYSEREIEEASITKEMKADELSGFISIVEVQEKPEPKKKKEEGGKE